MAAPKEGCTMTFIPKAPLFVNWNYTYACTFNCTHCYSRAESYPRELSSEQYRDIVKQLVAAGVFKVFLGGGEPFLRKDCLENIKSLRTGGIYTGVTTNAW